MRYFLTAIWAVPATICVSVIWFAVAVSNFTFGAAQGTNEAISFFGLNLTSSQLNGYSSVAIDGLMTTLVIVAIVAASNGSRWLAVLCGGMATLCVMWSLASVFGYTLSGRAGAADVRGHAMTTWSAVEKQLGEALKQQAMTPDHRPLPVVRADLDRARADERFSDTSACSTRLQGRVRFCESYRALLAEEAAASSSIDLQERVEHLRKEVDERQRVSSIDPTGDALSTTIGITGSAYGMGRAVLASMLSILLASCGFGAIWRAVHLALRKPSIVHSMASSIAEKRPDLARERVTQPQFVLSKTLPSNGFDSPSIVRKPIVIDSTNQPRISTIPSILDPARNENTSAMTDAIQGQSRISDDQVLEHQEQHRTSTRNSIVVPGVPVHSTSQPSVAGNIITPPQFTAPVKHEKKNVMRAGDVGMWIADCCNTSSDKSVSTTTQAARSSYEEWCSRSGFFAIDSKSQTKQMRKILRCETVRKASGAVFPGLQIARIGVGKVAAVR
jgi:hypothetical protein